MGFTQRIKVSGSQRQGGLIRRLSVSISLLLLGTWGLWGQDFHYSQFYHAPLHLNPALTGIFGGDSRVTANYRSQWTSVPVPYKTFSVLADQKFFLRRHTDGFFGAGLALNHDRAGDSRLTWASVDLSASYTRYLDPQWFLTAGLQLGAVQRSFSLDELRFDEQFDPLPGRYNPDLPIGETFGTFSRPFFDLGAGINLRWQDQQRRPLVDRLDKRSSFDLGVGLFHLNRPNQSFVEDADVPLPVRLSLYMRGIVQVSPEVDVVLAFSPQFQQPYQQMTGTAGIRYFLSRQLGKQVAIQLNAGYRFNDAFGDAFIPSLELYYNTIHAGFSYDINISDFSIATSRRGGPEIYIRYILKKVHPLPEFKICPLI